MSGHAVRAQACGCISLSDEVVAMLRMRPAAELALRVDAAGRVMTLQVISPAAEAAGFVERSACPLIDPA